MTDLRAKLVEAGAEALHGHVAKRERWEDKSFNLIPDVAQGVYRDWSAALLDVYLGCLAENADEWIYAEAKMPKPTPMAWTRQSRQQLDRLLAVLRRDIREQGEDIE